MVLEVRMVISCEMEKTLLADKWHERIFWNNGNVLSNRISTDPYGWTQSSILIWVYT